MDVDVRVKSQDLYNYGDYYDKAAEEQVQKAEAELQSPAYIRSQASEGEQALGNSAKNRLQMMRDAHPDMDIFVADLATEEQGNELMAKGSKKYTAVFTTQEMERFAADPGYGEKAIDNAEQTLRSTPEQLQELAEEAADDAADLAWIGSSRYGVAFNGDGSTTYFAQLTDSSGDSQKYVLARMAEKTAEKEEVKRLENELKKIIIQAASTKELYQKIRSVNWGQVGTSQVRVGKIVNVKA